MTRRLLLLAAAVTVVVGCVSRRGRPEGAENPKYTFPHATHAGAEVPCLSCHASVAQATAVGSTVHVALPRPSEAKVCFDCHERAPIPPPPRRHIERSITATFSHAAHMSYVKGDCTKCHTALPEQGDTKAPVPPMSTCTACHEHARDYAQARCQPCHVDLKRYPLKPIADYKHEGDFLRTHGQMAKTNAAACAECHEQTSCAECHAASTRPVKPDIEWPEKVGPSFIHRGDYVSRHTVDANADPASCRRCHGTAFCDACHREEGISQRSPSRDPHPPGWLAGVVHGPPARQDISSCAACHDQGARSTCVACHRNVNPHPPGWAQRHNKTTDVIGNSMCRTCHTP
jgi:hypothetical protein